MSYVLRGVIGPERELRSIGSAVATSVVPLAYGWFLLPWTPEAFDSLGESSETGEIPGLHFGHALLARELRVKSAAAPIAYIEAECWAGECEQGAAVYIDGELSWGSDFGPIEKEGLRRTPISEALARIGVELATAAVDEFASLGLDRKRQTEDWLE